MKLKKLLLVTLISVVAFSCSDPEEGNSAFELVDVTIPPAFQTDAGARTSAGSDTEEVNVEITTANGETFVGVMRFTMPANSDQSLLKLEVSQNILDRTGSQSDFWVTYYGNGNARTENSCIASCHDTYTDENGGKIKGRGWCKAECWAKTLAAPVGAVVVALIAQ